MFGPSIPIFTLLSVFAIFAVFVKMVALVGALLTSCMTAFHWLNKFSNFLQILQYLQFSQFRKNRSSCQGPLNSFFYRFLLTRRIFQFFADFTIFTIFAVFTKIAVLVGALSTPSSTGFHWLDEFYNFSQIYNLRNFRKNRSSHRGPLNPFFYRISLTRWIFSFFLQILHYSQFSQFSQKSQLRGPLNLLFYRFSLTWRIFQFFTNFGIFTAACKPGHISSRRTKLFTADMSRMASL